MFPPSNRSSRPSRRIEEVTQVKLAVVPKMAASSAGSTTTTSTTVFPYKQASVRSGFDQTYHSQTPSMRSRRTINLSSSSSTSLVSELHQAQVPNTLHHVRNTVGRGNGERPRPWKGSGFEGWVKGWVGSRESRHPRLAAVLAPSAPMDPRVNFDVRHSPKFCSIDPPLGTSFHQTPIMLAQFHNAPATQPPVCRMRIVSHDFPWMITVENSRGVTVGDVMEKVFTSLQAPVSHSEWWIAASKTRSRVTEAWEHNVAASALGPYGDKRSVAEVRQRSDCVRRVDWVLSKVFWEGLMRDDAFLGQRGLGFAGQRHWEGAWVLNMRK